VQGTCVGARGCIATSISFDKPPYGQKGSFVTDTITPTPVAAEKPRKPLYKRWWVYAVALVAVIGIAGTGSTPEATDSATPSATAESDSQSAGTETPAATTTDLGTQENPAQAGDTIVLDEWEITFNGATVATDAVLAENMLNEEPAPGYEYVLLDISAKYNGEESSTFWMDFSSFILGSEGNTFGTDLETICVAPDGMTGTGEVFTGGEVRGNVCVPMDMAQIDGATAVVDYSFAIGEERAFFNLGL
jgi:hypothetical protein